MKPYAARAVEVSPVSRLFKALGDDTRLRIVALLTHGELCVCHLEEALELRQSNVSRQLGILKHAGIVKARRDRTWVYYSLARQDDPQRRVHLKALVKAFGARDILRRDVARLLRAKGPGRCG